MHELGDDQPTDPLYRELALQVTQERSKLSQAEVDKEPMSRIERKLA
jgi:hypothetical protein